MEDLTDLLPPARVLVPDLPDEFVTATVETLTGAPVGVVGDSYAPRRDVEYLHVNDRGLELIREYHDPTASYDSSGRVRRSTTRG